VVRGSESIAAVDAALFMLTVFYERKQSGNDRIEYKHPTWASFGDFTYYTVEQKIPEYVDPYTLHRHKRLGTSSDTTVWCTAQGNMKLSTAIVVEAAS
jgi:hypothetical protein